jgi:hypothetical protein
LDLEVGVTDAPGVVAVTATANDRDLVTLTWDEIAGSVSVRWLSGSQVRLLVETEPAATVDH